MKETINERTQIVVFGLGKENFGVEINDLLEIVKVETITRIPNTEFFVEGVINLRGKIIVVLDLLKKLSGESTKKNNDTRILIIKTEQELIGLLVERCDNVLSLSKNEIMQTPNFLNSNISSDFIKGVINKKNQKTIKETHDKEQGKNIILLDLKKLFEGKDFSRNSK